MRKPGEIATRARDRKAPTGKAALRWNEFREQRGLSPKPKKLALGADGRVAASTSSYLNAVRQRATLLEKSPSNPDIPWRSLGPAAIPDCPTYGSAKTTVAGRVAAIAVDPNDSDHLLVGAAAGGVWQSTDGGGTWTPQTDDALTLSIGALAFDPSDPMRVYAGTGEGNTWYFDALGMGLLVSHDGGSTWTGPIPKYSEATNPEEMYPFADIGFYRIAVDPRDGKRLIAATTAGAFLSPDAGEKWIPLYLGITWDVSLAYRGDEPEILLATPDGLLAMRGTDVLSPVPIPGLPPLDDGERMAVAHVPSAPGQAFVFVATQGQAHLWHRSAAERPFEPVPLPSFRVPALPSSEVSSGRIINWGHDVLSVSQAPYDWHVSIPPDRDDTVYLGALELVKGKRTGDAWTWSNISSRQGSGDSIHPDQHTMAFDPRDSNIIYAGNDGGVFRSPDAGQSWQSLNVGLVISEVEYLTQRPDDPIWILAGLQDNGTIRRKSPDQWAMSAYGDGGDCGTNMANPNVCFHSYFRMQTERSEERGNLGSWKDVSPPEMDYQLFYPPLEVNGNVVVKAGQIVYVSTDSADHWVGWCLPDPTGQSDKSVASALAIPTQDQVLVGTIDGDVFRIHLTDNPWRAVTTLTRPQTGWISDLLVDPDRPERYWVTYSSVTLTGDPHTTPGDPHTTPGAVFRSDDQGATWIDVTSNLPSIPVNAVVTDPANPDRVWVACDVGVFESRNAGENWAGFNNGLPNVLATDLLFYEPDRLLRVGTRSRGIWEAQVH